MVFMVVGEPFNGWWIYGIWGGSIHILSKTQTDSSFIYLVEKQTYGMTVDMPQYQITWNGSPYISTMEIHRRFYTFVDVYPNNIILHPRTRNVRDYKTFSTGPYYSDPYFPEQGEATTVSLKLDSMGRFVKGIMLQHPAPFSYEKGVYVYIQPSQPLSFISNWTDDGGVNTFVEGLGQIEETYNGFEFGMSFKISSPIISNLSNQSTSTISLGPNPNYGDFWIETGAQTNSSITMTLYSQAGQTLLQKELIPSNGKIRVQVPELPSGFYFGSLNLAGQLRTFKVMIKEK